jgi:hypothetical protein
MPSNPQPAPARLEDGWHAIVVASGALFVTELLRVQLGIGATTFGPLGRILLEEWTESQVRVLHELESLK